MAPSLRPHTHEKLHSSCTRHVGLQPGYTGLPPGVPRVAAWHAEGCSLHPACSRSRHASVQRTQCIAASLPAAASPAAASPASSSARCLEA